MYDSALGRYLTPDPSGYPDGPNNYLYVQANPINNIDPLGLSVATRIVKGVRKGLTKNAYKAKAKLLSKFYQVHHKIGQEFFSDPKLGPFLKEIGQSQDAASNLITLPNKIGKSAGVKGSKRSLHQGRHIKEYTDDIAKELNNIYDLTKSGAMKPKDASTAVDALKGKLHKGLKDGSIALQRSEYDLLKTGSLSVGLITIRLDDDSVNKLVENKMKAEAVREHHKYAKYLTAKQYLGDGFLGTAIDMINPAEDVIFGSDLLQDFGNFVADKPMDSPQKVMGTEWEFEKEKESNDVDFGEGDAPSRD